MFQQCFQRPPADSLVIKTLLSGWHTESSLVTRFIGTQFYLEAKMCMLANSKAYIRVLSNDVLDGTLRVTVEDELSGRSVWFSVRSQSLQFLHAVEADC